MTKKEMEKKIEELEKEVKFLKQNLTPLPNIPDLYPYYYSPYLPPVIT